MQPAQERKAWCEPNAADAVLSGAVNIDNFNWIDLRLPGNVLEIESKLGLVTNRNLDQTRARVSLLATPAARERFVHFLCERLNDMIGPGGIAHHAKRIKKNCDGRVSGCEFDHARNTRVRNLPERAENLIRGLLRRVFELIANPHDERGISERRDFHRFGVINPLALPEELDASLHARRFDLDVYRYGLADSRNRFCALAEH